MPRKPTPQKPRMKPTIDEDMLDSFIDEASTQNDWGNFHLRSGKLAELINNYFAYKIDRPSNPWRPISEAPRDGTNIILWNKDWASVEIMYYHNGYWRDDEAGVFEENEPAHFMPLPQPPEE